MGHRELGPTREASSLMFSVGKNVEVSFDRDNGCDAWFPSKVLEHCESGFFLVEGYRTVDKKASIDKVTVDSFHIRPFPPDIKRKKFNLLEKVDAFYDLAWWSGVITRELAGSRYIVFFKHTNKEKELNGSDLRPHMDWKDGQWFTTSRETKHLGDGKSSTHRRKRGRPPKKLTSTPTDMEPSGDHSKDESSGPVELAMMVCEDGKEQLEDQMGHSRKGGRMKKITQTNMSHEKAVQSLSQQHEKHYVKREKRQAKSFDIESQAQGSVDSSGVKTAESNRITTNGGEVLAEIPCNGLGDQSLAKWFEKIQSLTSVDGSRVSPARSPKQCAELREKQDMPMQIPVNGTPATETETQSLPFVKNTLLWSTIESMDIFRSIPQKPHFNPLEHCKESSREGLAIGYMVTFLSTVERISRLHYDDPRSTIEEILETLSDLETHGFDVQLVRDHLTELLLMKDKQEKLETQVADIDTQIITLNMVREHIDGEIEEINEQIAELQDRLSLVTSRKEVTDREIDGLRSKLMDIQADTKKAHNEFDSLASKPL